MGFFEKMNSKIDSFAEKAGETAAEGLMAYMETVKPALREEDEGRYEKVRQEVRIENSKDSVAEGEILVVRFLRNSEITVKTGGALDATFVEDCKIFKEQGAEIKTFLVDSTSIQEITPKEFSQCRSCGAPWEGKKKCDYCGTHFS